MHNKSGLIYKITCLLNGKSYIGQTISPMKERWQAHCRCDSPCLKLKRAIEKYGKENFKIEKIDGGACRKELNDKEIFWISFFDTQKNGYNITNGGNNTSKSRKVVCIESGELFDSIGECCASMGTKPNLVSAVCYGRKATHKGKHFAFTDENDKPIMKYVRNPRQAKKVICLETGKIYHDTFEASRCIGISRQAISNVVYNITPTAKGLHFCFLDKDGKPIINNEQIKKRRRKTLVQCVETGEIFDSPKAVAERFGCYDSSCVCQAIRKGCKTMGHHFVYYKKGEIECLRT